MTCPLALDPAVAGVFDVAASRSHVIVAHGQDGPVSSVALLDAGQLISLPGLGYDVGHSPTFVDEDTLVFSQNQRDGSGFDLIRWSLATSTGETLYSTEDGGISEALAERDGSVVFLLVRPDGATEVRRIGVAPANEADTLFELPASESLAGGTGDGLYFVRPTGSDVRGVRVVEATGAEVGRLDGWLPVAWLRDVELLVVADGASLGVVHRDRWSAVLPIGVASVPGSIVTGSFVPQ